MFQKQVMCNFNFNQSKSLLTKIDLFRDIDKTTSGDQTFEDMFDDSVGLFVSLQCGYVIYLRICGLFKTYNTVRTEDAQKRETRETR